MTTTFVLPIKRVSEDKAIQGSLVFQPSSRILALVNKTSKSIGASCNVFQLQDSIGSIADGHKWAYHVLAYQGAPSVDFSNLRPQDANLGSGGKSSGAVSFMKPFDAIVSIMRREEKKNGAGIAYLDYSHPDLDDFLSLETKATYKAVYIPMHDTPEADELLANDELVSKLTKAYNDFRCFLVKRPFPVNDQSLFINLCTEVEIPHKGFCILGAVNLSQYTEDTLVNLPRDFKNAAVKMLDYMQMSLESALWTDLECYSELNRQFGLGVFGLASLLGRLGITYKEFADELEWAFSGENDDISIHFLASLYTRLEKPTKAELVVSSLLKAYSEATTAVAGDVRAAFCIQPTVSTSKRCFDSEGYHSSPEIAPVQGLRHELAVSTVFKSEVKGDELIDYHPKTWTMDDVPYEDYARVSALWQRVMDSTGLAHRHSHCFYGEQFTEEDFVNFYKSELKYRKSLYYRLPWQVNTQSLDKSKLWQEINEGELTDFDVNALLSGGGTQMPGTITCDCQM